MLSSAHKWNQTYVLCSVILICGDHSIHVSIPSDPLILRLINVVCALTVSLNALNLSPVSPCRRIAAMEE